MLLNSLRGIVFAIFTAGVTLALSLLFRTIPAIGKANFFGIDAGFIIGLWLALPLAQAIFRRISWLRIRGL